jgi:hypothetical protein
MDLKSIKIPEIPKELKKQDFSQRITVGTSVILELYRVITCSLLIIFIPQKCDDHICSVTENLIWDNTFYNTALVFNFITLFAFCPLYFLEIKRENRLIKYLDVNPNLPSDDKGVENTLTVMQIDKKQKIIQIDKYYQKYAYIMICIYIINAGLSGAVVGEYYIGNQTASTYVTYILLILTKLNNVYTIANTQEHVFYSAYLKTNVQYNDIDENSKLIIDNIDEEAKIDTIKN